MATILSGSFTGTGQSSTSPGVPVGKLYVVIRASTGVGTVKVQKSLNGGTTWFDVSKDTSGTPASYDINNSSIDVIEENLQNTAVYRFNCTAFTSGTLFYEMGHTQ